MFEFHQENGHIRYAPRPHAARMHNPVSYPRWLPTVTVVCPDRDKHPSSQASSQSTDKPSLNRQPTLSVTPTSRQASSAHSSVVGSTDSSFPSSTPAASLSTLNSTSYSGKSQKIPMVVLGPSSSRLNHPDCSQWCYLLVTIASVVLRASSPFLRFLPPRSRLIWL